MREAGGTGPEREGRDSLPTEEKEEVRSLGRGETEERKPEKLVSIVMYIPSSSHNYIPGSCAPLPFNLTAITPSAG